MQIRTGDRATATDHRCPRVTCTTLGSRLRQAPTSTKHVAAADAWISVGCAVASQAKIGSDQSIFPIAKGPFDPCKVAFKDGAVPDDPPRLPGLAALRQRETRRRGRLGDTLLGDTLLLTGRLSPTRPRSPSGALQVIGRHGHDLLSHAPAREGHVKAGNEVRVEVYRKTYRQ